MFDEYFNFLPVIAILMNLVSGFFIALKLYQSAPEKDEISFNKYCHAMMVDAAPGEKTLLKFEGDRYEWFITYRIVSLICVAVVVLYFAIQLLRKVG